MLMGPGSSCWVSMVPTPRCCPPLPRPVIPVRRRDGMCCRERVNLGSDPLARVAGGINPIRSAAAEGRTDLARDAAAGDAAEGRAGGVLVAEERDVERLVGAAPGGPVVLAAAGG